MLQYISIGQTAEAENFVEYDERPIMTNLLISFVL